MILERQLAKIVSQLKIYMIDYSIINSIIIIVVVIVVINIIIVILCTVSSDKTDTDKDY